MKLQRFIQYLMIAIPAMFVCSCSDDAEDAVATTGNSVAFGTVLDEQSNEPLQGASVTLYPSGRTVVTGATGQYEFRDLLPGGYLLQVSKADFLSNTQSVTISGTSTTAQSDIVLTQGTPCLDVLIGELYFGEKSNSKTFVVSNVGQQPINWNLYTDYNRILSFNVTSGVLEPGQSQAVEATMNRALTNADLTSFPVYVYANGEELGVIATIDRNTAGQNNSLLVGEWELVYAQFMIDDEVWYNQYDDANFVYNIRPDYTIESCVRNIVSNDNVSDLNDMLYYLHDITEYDYDVAKNILILDPDMGFRNSVYRINTLNENTLEIESLLTVGTPEWDLKVFKRR